MKFEGCVSLGSMSLLPDSRGGEEEVEVKKKKKKTEQKQEVFRAVARTPNEHKQKVFRAVARTPKKRTKTRGVASVCSNT